VRNCRGTDMLRARTVDVLFVEPWDLASDTGPVPRPATVCRVSPDVDRMLLRLDTPFVHRSVEWQYAIASPRLVHGSFADLAGGGVVSCNLAVVPEDCVTADRWWDGAHFRRSGGTAIADLRLVLGNDAKARGV